MLERYTKGIISLLVLAFAMIALFWGDNIFGFHITADFQSQVIALIPLAAATIAVIGTKNATPDAIDKAIMQLVLGMIAVGQFFTQIPSDLGVKIGAFVYAGVAAFFVWWKANSPSTT